MYLEINRQLKSLLVATLYYIIHLQDTVLQDRTDN